MGIKGDLSCSVLKLISLLEACERQLISTEMKVDDDEGAAPLVSLPLVRWLLSAAAVEEPIQPPSDCYRPQHLRPSPRYVLLDSISSTSMQPSDFCLPLLSLPVFPPPPPTPPSLAPRMMEEEKKKNKTKEIQMDLDVQPGRALCSLPRGKST